MQTIIYIAQKVNNEWELAESPLERFKNSKAPVHLGYGGFEIYIQKHRPKSKYYFIKQEDAEKAIEFLKQGIK
jgi:hypothetical protein